MNMEGPMTPVEPKAKTYLGAAILNGPAGAPDTPERYQPKPPTGVPTVMSVPILACSPQEARAKQVLWHCLADRINDLTGEKTCQCYASEREAAIRYLDALRDRIINTVVPALAVPDPGEERNQYYHRWGTAERQEAT